MLKNMLKNKNISLVLSVLGLHLHSYYRFYIVSKSCALKWQMKWLKWLIPLPLPYTSASYIPTHLYTWSLKKVPFQARPPCRGHYREYHPQPKVAFYTFDLRQVYIVQDSYSFSFFFSLEFLSSLPIPNACK